MRVGVVFALVLGTCALAVGPAGATRADVPVLTGDVGSNDSFSLSLKDAAGAPVSHLDTGTYTLVVHDHSSFHDFHLSGPGVDVSTDVDAIGDRTFTVTLTDGTYFFQCDPHSSQMHGTFTVGTVTTTTTPVPAPPPPVKLAALVTGAKVSLRPVAGLSAGSAAITVADRSAVDGFRLAGPGIAKATGVAFKGTVTWRVRLRAGRYTFSSVRHPRLRGSFVVGP